MCACVFLRTCAQLMECVTLCAMKRMTKWTSLWVCVYFSGCLIHQIQLKPVNRHPSIPQNVAKINPENKNIFPLPPGLHLLHWPTSGAGRAPFRTSSSLHSGNRSTCPKSQPMPLTACDGAENIFPSLWLWWISRCINHKKKEMSVGGKQRFVKERVCALIAEPKPLMKWACFFNFRRNQRVTINCLQRLNPISKTITSPQPFMQTSNSDPDKKKS